jgi:steroid 5-alpha reductase family enzyme
MAPFVVSLAAAVGAFVALWLASFALRDVSIVDVYWGPGFVVLALVAAATGAGTEPRRTLVLVLTAAWGLRLGAHLLRRNRGRGEDFRYAAMRRRAGARFALTSLATVFLLQAGLMWTVSWPVQWAVAVPSPPALGGLDAAGVAVFAAGLVFEALGDLQLARFRADPANAGRVMDRGLWRWTRHPNYFGDACVWWGLWLVACAVPGGWRTIVGPALMTFLLRRVSGVPILERSLARRRPGYAEYVARTSAFVPLPPRRR